MTERQLLTRATKHAIRRARRSGKPIDWKQARALGAKHREIILMWLAGEPAPAKPTPRPKLDHWIERRTSGFRGKTSWWAERAAALQEQRRRA